MASRYRKIRMPDDVRSCAGAAPETKERQLADFILEILRMGE